MEEKTGVSQDTATDAVSGASDGNVTQDAQPESGAPPAQAGSDLAQQLAQKDATIQELRSVQSGQDKRIAELQDTMGTLQEQRDEFDSEVARLNDVLNTDGDTSSKYEEQLRELRSSAAERQSELESQLENTSQEAETFRSENERLKVLVGEYPNLAALVEANALPQADDLDEFRTKLESLNDRFVSKESADAYQRQSGSRPPASPGKGSSQSLDELWATYKSAPDGSQEKAEALDAWYEATGREFGEQT